MSNDKTIYTIKDELFNDTTITLDKFVADIFQEIIPDVHAWVQATYNKVAKNRPHLGRRQKGDIVRALSWNKAIDHLKETGQLDDF